MMVLRSSTNGGMSKIHFAIDVVVPRIMEIGMQRIPNEACGIIVPDLDRSPDDWVFELTNRSPDPTNSYDLDPKVMKQVIGTKKVWDDVLVWHTHPSGHVGPSIRDWDSMIPGVKYLVVALPSGEAVMFGKDDE